MSEVERILSRFEGAVRFLFPSEMTPHAKRLLESIIEAERAQIDGSRPLLPHYTRETCRDMEPRQNDGTEASR